MSESENESKIEKEVIKYKKSQQSKLVKTQPQSNIKNYIKPRNNNFINQFAWYDRKKVDREIKDLDLELKKQLILSEKFDNNNEEMLHKCTDFLDENGDIIEKQYNKIHEINGLLKETVHKNQEQAEINDDLKELINSEEYMQITAKMSNIRSTINNLKDFLEEEGIHSF